VSSTTIGIVLGLLVGLRHSFEPDHLTAVSTLVGETRDLRGGALLGALWGIGHTLSLVGVGVILMLVGASLPERAAVVFELGVAAMLLVLGVRSIAVAIRAAAVHHRLHTADRAHVHPGAHAHAHAHAPPELRRLAWRPLAVGLVHGLAGSGALTAIVFADLPGVGARLVYMTLFGLGSIAGMALASGAAGATLRVVARSGGTRRGLSIATGAVSIAVGVMWAIPLWSRLG
jgi:ABC-type nickel/cobalt efflux system permease component RcnA